MSQEQLAEAAGLHRTYISMVERGVNVPTLAAVRKLALALGTSMSALITEVEKKL